LAKSPPTFAHIVRPEFQTRVRNLFIFLRFENYRCLDRVLNSAQYTWNRILNSVPASCYYIAHPVHFFFIFFQLTISLKSLLLLLQELLTGNLFFDRSRADPYSPLSSHQRFKFFFSIKLKYTNSRVYRSYCRDENIADQCVSRRSNLENFNRHGLRYSCCVHIFCRRGNQSS
jgi:hypothetical protein